MQVPQSFECAGITSRIKENHFSRIIFCITSRTLTFCHTHTVSEGPLKPPASAATTQSGAATPGGGGVGGGGVIVVLFSVSHQTHLLPHTHSMSRTTEANSISSDPTIRGSNSWSTPNDTTIVGRSWFHICKMGQLHVCKTT